uniref:DUF4939 domain-containing protein n=1 Tax=Scleropages formosus TaxID=113540 RepID=A0A8C9SWZ4_SCLFO
WNLPRANGSDSPACTLESVAQFCPAAMTEGSALKTDSAETACLHDAVAVQDAALRAHEQKLEQIEGALQTEGVIQAPDDTAETTLHGTPPMVTPSAPDCQAFLMQCELVFSSSPQVYHTDETKIAFLVSLLTGPLRRWAPVDWPARPQTTYQEGLQAQEAGPRREMPPSARPGCAFTVAPAELLCHLHDVTPCRNLSGLLDQGVEVFRAGHGSCNYHCLGNQLSTHDLIDSGATGCFMDAGFKQANNIPRMNCDVTLCVSTLDG